MPRSDPQSTAAKEDILRKIYIAQRQSHQPRELVDLGSSLSSGIFSILADDAPTIFCNIIHPHFNLFISSLAALVWGSDRGGPVEEAEKAKVASVWRT